MGELVNLRRERKARARAAAARSAAENRRRFGRSKAEKELARTDAARERAVHEGHRLPTPGTEATVTGPAGDTTRGDNEE